MLIQLVSDLHQEMRDEALQALPGWRDPDADLLVMAGDICNWVEGSQLRALRAAVAGWKRVLYVPGNHEYYDGSPGPCTVKAIQELLGSSIDVAYTPGFRVIGDKRFLCGTMWYRLSAVSALPGAVPYQGRWHDRAKGRYRTFNDFRFTKDLAPWCYQQNDSFRACLDFLQPGDVVVTHHLPSSLSTPQQFRNEIDNCFFVCDVEAEIKGLKPSAWLHGHTHTPFDYGLGSTRVVANPLGYRHERRVADYKPLLLEI